MSIKQLKLKTITPLQVPSLHLPLGKYDLKKEIREDFDRRISAAEKNIFAPSRKLLRRLRKSFFVAWAYYVLHPNIKKYAVRSFIGLMILDGLLLSLFMIKLVSPLSESERAATSSYMSQTASVRNAFAIQSSLLGPETNSLIAFFKQLDILAVPIKTIERPGFSVLGRIVSAKGDNFTVFEYGDEQTARTEAAAMTERYSSQTKSGLWDSRVHIYRKGALVIYYLGTSETITAALAAFSGAN